MEEEKLEELVRMLKKLHSRQIESVRDYVLCLLDEDTRGNESKSSSDKDLLMRHLRNGVWVRLQPSNIPGCGVGVVALQDIPAGIDPFPICNRHRMRECGVVTFSETELHQSLHPSVMKYLCDFTAPMTEDDDYNAPPCRSTDGGLEYGVNATGLNTLDVSWFLNHSDEPNTCVVAATEPGEFNSYRTLTVVSEGEELLFDYGELGRAYKNRLDSQRGP